jgi:hypothetical protein
VEHLFDFQLALRLKVGARSTRSGQYGTRPVRQQADGLGPAGVNAQDVKGLSSIWTENVGHARETTEPAA